MTQATLDGIPPLPAERGRGRPTKAAAAEHADKLAKAILAGRAGAKRAADRADRKRTPIPSTWTEEACAKMLEYAAVAGSGGFLIEVARAHAEMEGLAPPPDKRAWGRIPRMLSKGTPGKRLEACGVGRSASSNGSFKVKWRLA